MFRQIGVMILLILCCSGISAQTTQEWRDSVAYLSRLIDENPKNLELRMRKAEANIALEQWNYALDEYSNILDLHPKHIGALYFRGYVNNHLKRYNFARQDYEQVLDFEPGHKGALMGLILVNVADNRVTRAFDLANLLIELYADDAKCYSLRAQVEEAMGLIDPAISDISTAIDMEEERMSAYQRLSINDDMVQYIVMRIALTNKKMASIKKKSDDYCRDAILADKKLLLSRGLPGKWVKSIK